ncbi:MAG: hypothetical protein ACK4R9_11465 [Ignavibacterium sp.]
MLGFLTFKNRYYASIVITNLWGLIILLLNFIDYKSKLLSLIGYTIYFIATYLLIKALWNNHSRINLFTRLFLVWLSYMILSSIPILFNNYRNYLYLKQFISGGFFLYLIPFLMVARLNINFYKLLLNFSYRLIFIYLVTNIFLFFYFIQDIKNGGESLTFLMAGAAPLVMTLPYHSKKHRTIIIISLLLLLFQMMIIGRRNVVVYFGSVLFLSIFVSVFSKQSLHINKKSYYIKLAISILFTFILVFSIFSKSFEFFFDRVQSGMSSRKDIIELFILDFNTKPADWILGRGIFGQFEGGILATDEDTGLRDLIENGYLFLILKGGGIYLVLLFIISVNAMYKGFFKSRNTFVKGFAAIILIYYIDMIGYGIPFISLKYILVFIAIAACNTPWLREQTDEVLSKEIGLK